MKKFDYIGFFSYIGILGAVSLNIMKSPVLANILWIFSNGFFIIHHLRNKEYHQSRMFATFLTVSLIGIFNWNN